jgi:hypothetical protein
MNGGRESRRPRPALVCSAIDDDEDDSSQQLPRITSSQPCCLCYCFQVRAIEALSSFHCVCYPLGLRVMYEV